ncbi:MAG TPA: DapH/DapD/GlmU-related protein [Polyangiaceae bacterium]|nr:DapH/DapD/GlmU-related protein [Polyangiaceae bacterium]
MDRSNPQSTGWRKVMKLLREETSGIHPRLIALNTVAGFLPRYQARQTRARLFSFAGFRIGDGTRLAAVPRINGGPNLFSNLVVGRECSIDTECMLDLSERITIGNRVTISPGVMILTSTHELDIREHRAGPVQMLPVSIGDGAWLGARCVVLPGVTIGAGAIVNPGSVVNKDVTAQTRVGGTPAVVVEVLAPPEGASSE